MRMTELPKSLRDAMAKQAADYAGGVGESGFEDYMIGWTDCYEYLLSQTIEFDEDEVKASAQKSEALHVPYTPEIVPEYNAFVRGARHQHAQTSAIYQAKLAQKDAEINQLTYELDKSRQDHQRIISQQEQEIERLKADSIHTCHDQCQRTACVLRREVERLKGLQKDHDEDWKRIQDAEREIERLKAENAQKEIYISELKEALHAEVTDYASLRANAAHDFKLLKQENQKLAARLEIANTEIASLKHCYSLLEDQRQYLYDKGAEVSAKLEIAVKIIDGLLESHANLYEAHFGHLGLKPDDDTVRKDALEALAKIKGME